MTWTGVAKGAVLGALALVLTLDASVQEFVDLIALSDDARRERFGLPKSCTPIISAIKSAAPNESRLLVVIDCGTATTEPSPSASVKPTSWKHE